MPVRLMPRRGSTRHVSVRWGRLGVATGHVANLVGALVFRTALGLGLSGTVLAASTVADPATDPLHSPSWPSMHQRMLGGMPFEFSDAVTVLAPPSAEDPTNVPVSIRLAPGIDPVRVVVFADLNPIQKVLELEPMAVPASFGIRLKIEQGTPIRAAALTRDGVWLVGGRWVDAAGGGCTQPSEGRVTGNWDETIGQFRYHSFAESDSDALARVRFRIMHPMDTGLSPGIPAFYIDEIKVTAADGALLARFSVFEPVSENPYFTIDFGALEAERGPLTFSFHDIGGNRFEHLVQTP